MLHAALALDQDIVEPGGRLREADLGGKGVPDDAVWNACKAARDVAWLGRVAETGHGLGIDGAEDQLRIDQDTVTVEDDE